MNTATRVMTTRQYQTENAKEFNFPKINIVMSLLVFVIFLSAFSIVYLKDLNRRLFIQYQNLQQTHQNQQLLWGKLLLKQSNLSIQARIQTIAEKKLAMMVPKQKDVVLVED